MNFVEIRHYLIEDINAAWNLSNTVNELGLSDADIMDIRLKFDDIKEDKESLDYINKYLEMREIDDEWDLKAFDDIVELTNGKQIGIVFDNLNRDSSYFRNADYNLLNLNSLKEEIQWKDNEEEYVVHLFQDTPTDDLKYDIIGGHGQKADSWALPLTTFSEISENPKDIELLKTIILKIDDKRLGFHMGIGKLTKLENSLKDVDYDSKLNNKDVR